MKTFGTVASIMLLVVIGGCGGSDPEPTPNPTPGGTVSTVLPPLSDNTHRVQLGPIAGAGVTVFRPDCATSLYQATTDANGTYAINVEQLKRTIGSVVPEILCVEAVGGKDVDPNDDGIRASGEEIIMRGKIRGYVKTGDLLGGSGTRVNLFGSAIADLLAQTDDVTIARIEKIARQLSVPDIDNDGKVTISDVTRYEMGSKSNGEEYLKDYYLRAVHEGNTANRQYFVNTTDTVLAAIRQVITPINSISAALTLIPFSRNATIRFGREPQEPLPNIYNIPFVVNADDLLYMQECGSVACYPIQVIQINKKATNVMRYTDTGGVNLTAYYANEQLRKDLLAKIDVLTTSIAETNTKIMKKGNAIATLDDEISQLQNDAAAIEAEILWLSTL